MKKYFSLLALILSVSIVSCDKETIDNGGITPENVYGCTDENAMNYNSEATDDNGSCEYSTEYLVSGEWSITHLEYETAIDLTSIDASVLPAEIATILAFLGDEIPIEGEAEDAGTYSLNLEDNTYVGELAFDTEPVPVFGAIELPSIPMNLDSEGTWTIQGNDEEIVFVDGTTGVQQVYQIENLTEDFALLRGLVMAPVALEMFGEYDFEVEMVLQLEKQ